MKILVNGCSHIEGTGLASDSSDTRNITWPSHVWHNHDVKNIAEPGSSNDKICRCTIDELEKQSYDFVCVQWSIFERIELQIPIYQKYGLTNQWACLHSCNAIYQNDINGNGQFMHELAKSIFLKQFDTQWFDNYNLSQILVLQNFLEYVRIPYLFVMTEWPTTVKWTLGRATLVNLNQILDLSWFDFCKKHNFNKIDEAHYEYRAHRAFVYYVEQELQKKGIVK